MLVLFSVAFYLEELDFYISNQGEMKRGFQRSLLSRRERQRCMERKGDTSDAGQVMKGERGGSEGGGREKKKISLSS